MEINDKECKNGKFDLSLNTYVKYVDDFKFWVMAAGLAHRIPEKDIVKCVVDGLKPEIFKEEMFYCFLGLATLW